MSRDYVLQPFRTAVDLQIDYAAELNPQQLAAVTALPGPALVIAGAGAGKTRTLTYRVAYLLEQGIPPNQILLLTFTNKAAREMMRRVADLLTHDLADLWGGTFHSIGNRILRRHADRIGYRRDFTILDREDATDLVSACLGEAKIDVKATRFPKPDVLAEVFSLAANTRQSVAELLEHQFHHFGPLTEQISALETRYKARKRESGVMDFDDLLALWLRLLQEDAETREHFQRRFQFILVDEYQDTNRLQSDIVDLLAARHHNVMAVGDDSQSIYSWRGANFLNILKFPERHPNAAVYKIETNYRSTPEILSLANAAISPNQRQFAKQLAAVRPAGQRPALVHCDDAQVQAAFVAQRALELREEGVPLDEMAVLYRSHFHTLELQMELTRRNIPFSITSGIRFFEQAHLKDVTAFLKLICNPRDEIAFKRLVRMLPGIGPVAADKFWHRLLTVLPPADAPPPPESADTTGGEAVAAAANVASPPDATPPLLATALQGIVKQVPAKAAVAWAQLTATIAQLEAAPMRANVTGMITLVIEAFYEDYLEANYANHRSRLEDLDQLALYGRQFQDLHEFLSQLALLSNVEAEGESQSRDDEERLRLSTVHQAKGLEFKVVFVIMLCDGLFPSGRSAETPEGEEEERRLFYVAITRAKDELYLCYPMIRTMGASGGDRFQQLSRFLRDLPEATFDAWNLQSPTWGG